MANQLINDDQRKRLFGVGLKLFSKEELYENIESWVGKNSVKALTMHEAAIVIGKLDTIENAPAAEPTGLTLVKKSKFVFVKGFLTEAQFGLIHVKKTALGWKDKGLDGFIKHTAGHSDILKLRVKEASAVIVGLDNMIKEKN